MRMVRTTAQTVKASNGQKVEKSLKDKELRMTEMQLEHYVSELLVQQDGRCALSGMLQCTMTQRNLDLWASLDRIDSDRHYEKGNLQVVCRFLNQWKQSMANDEFCDHLERLRQHWAVEDGDNQ